MNPSIRLCLVLHNHQPVGNFDDVIEQAYHDSYLPFLNVFERYEHLNISLHTSGPLAEWFELKHPEYLDRVADLVSAGRIEIIGGAFYEPILTMIPARDRIGQIESFSQWLESRFNTSIRGMWIPERVWEQSLTSDIASAGIEYSILDDYHFRRAGVHQNQLTNYFITEDEGETLKIFPGSEQLRYLIPFAQPQQTIDMLRAQAESHPGSVAVFGDDGEKFGTWPDTKRHVYDERWLERFFDALSESRDWLSTCTLEEAATQVSPAGKVYLPDSSYREMTEWSLPVSGQNKLDDLKHSFQDDPRWESIAQFMQGGFWRNFKVKYPETNEMYARMISVSQQLQDAIEKKRKLRLSEQFDPEQIQLARLDLYRGQCNCSYWHGAFGGAYLPHLRNAVFQHLISAENRLNEIRGIRGERVLSEVADFNFDGNHEVRLENESLVAWAAPACGGQLYELDVREIRHNLLASITRREEAYHEKIRHNSGQEPGNNHHHDSAASIHDRVVCKQEGLDQHLQSDAFKRNSLIDHFYDPGTSLAAIVSGAARERGGFANGRYSAKVLRKSDRIQLRMQRTAKIATHDADKIELQITKGITITSGSSALEISYLVDGIPQDQELRFAIELNLAGLPANADDRFFRQGEQRVGHLGTQHDFQNIRDLNLVDQWLGVDIGISANRATNLWTYPVQTVSQSESGFELVHQAVCLQPHWLIRGNSAGQWTVTLRLHFDTALATSRQPATEMLVAQ